VSRTMDTRSRRIRIGSPGARGKQAFALVAALGVLAILFIMIVGVATLANTGLSAVALQEADARLDSLLDSVQGKIRHSLSTSPALPQAQFSVTLPYGTGTGIVESPQSDAAFYRQGALVFLDGDMLMKLRAEVPYLGGRLAKERQVLANRAGRRMMPIVLNEAVHSPTEQKEQEKQ
jgi:hypothetical protein